MNLLVVVGTNTIGGLDLLLAAASGTCLSNGDRSSNFESLNAVTCALGGLSLALFGPGVVHTTSTGVGIWISHGISSLVGSGTSCTKLKLSVIFSLAVSILLSLVIAEDISEFQILDRLISWKAVINSSLGTFSAVVVTIIIIIVIAGIPCVATVVIASSVVAVIVSLWRSIIIIVFLISAIIATAVIIVRFVEGVVDAVTVSTGGGATVVSGSAVTLIVVVVP